MLSKLLLLLLAALAVTHASALTLYEPPDGLVYLSANLDTSNSVEFAKLFNERLGRKTAAFELFQYMPTAPRLWSKDNVHRIQATFTDAIVFLTVHPTTDNGDLDLQQPGLDGLVNQLDSITHPYDGSSRRVMLQFAPEMNGNWFRDFSQRPTAWKNAYRRIVDAVRARTNRVSFVWSPHVGNNYPFGPLLDNAEISALDTNGDGRVTFEDDPYAPYWPGADYVDWVGISLSWKGSDGNRTNDVPPPDYFEQMLFGSEFTKVNPAFSLYRDFCEKYNKPMLLSEGGAAFHLAEIPSSGGSPIPLPAGAGHLAIARGFWRSAITNITFLTRFPRFKMFNLFERIVYNEDIKNRDYRITNDTTILNAFRADLDNVADRYAWAGPFRPGTDPLKLIPKTSGSVVEGDVPFVSPTATSTATRTGVPATVAVTVTTTTKAAAGAAASVGGALVAWMGMLTALLVM
ncbi:hypothetical protein HDU96_010027 [Phlyctochytrium bullatum]|nr:hypothetical protein HDU96_010027 [Phlyctochytrium bullatum]